MSVYWIWLSQHPELTEQEKQALARCCPDPEDLYFPDREGPWAEEMAEVIRKARSSRLAIVPTGIFVPGCTRT